jgi:hypothetical protein
LSNQHVTYRQLAAAAEAAGVRASDAIAIASNTDEVITDADQFVAELATSFPSLKTASEPAQPAAPLSRQEQVEAARLAEGQAIGRLIDHARVQAGRPPIFTSPLDAA